MGTTSASGPKGTGPERCSDGDDAQAGAGEGAAGDDRPPIWSATVGGAPPVLPTGRAVPYHGTHASCGCCAIRGWPLNVRGSAFIFGCYADLCAGGGQTSKGYLVPSIDLSLEELHSYRAQAVAPADLADFWARTSEQSDSQPLDVTLEAVGSPLARVGVFRLSFAGFGSGRVTGWYLRPESEEPVPGVVSFHGYSGRALRPLEAYPLAAQGIAVLSMDCRGQAGDSDPVPGASAHAAGWLTQGLEDPWACYYRTVYADAVRSIEVLCSFPEVDAARIALTGVSQGGGLTLAAAALSTRPMFAWADVPFLCDFPRAVQVATEDPYLEIPRLLVSRPGLAEAAFRTLSYVDVANLAPRISCPVVVTVGLWDPICPPSTIFGMFARISVNDKDLRIYPFNGHEVVYDNAEARHSTLVSRLGALGA